LLPFGRAAATALFLQNHLSLICDRFAAGREQAPSPQGFTRPEYRAAPTDSRPPADTAPI